MSKKRKLDADDFYPRKKLMSFPMNKCATYQQKADFYSPMSENRDVPVADLALFAEYHATKETSVFDEARVGVVVKASRTFALQRVDTPGDKFYVPLKWMHNSACLMWPCTRVAYPGASGKQFLKGHVGLLDPLPVPIYDLTMWNAIDWNWESWAQQKVYCGNMSVELACGLRRTIEGQMEPFFDKLCRHCFYGVCKTTVLMVCRNYGKAVDRDLSHFMLCFTVIQDHLGLNDSDTLDICALFLSESQLLEGMCDAVLGLENALEVMEKMDEQKFKNEQSAINERREARRGFAREYRARRVACRPPAPPPLPAPPVARGPGGRRGPLIPLGAGGGRPVRISMATANELKPPKTSVWRGLKRQEWCGECKPDSRIHAKLRDFPTEELCLKDVLQLLIVKISTRLSLRGI